MKSSNIKINLVNQKLYSTSQQAFTLENSKKIGEKKDMKIFYSPYEVMLLIERKKAKLIKNNKELTSEELIKVLSKDNKNFYINFLVFKKLREKGYIVKTGSKFGSEFRIYENSINKHAKYIVFILKKKDKINPEEFISKSRIAHSAAKKLLLAIVDEEDNILFYESDWLKI